MSIQTETQRNNLATQYAAKAVSVALTTTVPGATAGTEVTGGSYARQTPTWSTAATSATNCTVTFSVPAGTTVKGVEVFDSGGTYLDGAAIGGASGQNFATAGTYQVTLTYTQS